MKKSSTSNAILDDEDNRMPVKQSNDGKVDETLASSEGTTQNVTNSTSSEENGESSKSINEDIKPAVGVNLGSSPVRTEKQTIRVVSIERLLRPSLVGSSKDTNRKANNKSPCKSTRGSRKSKENISIIEISDDDSSSSSRSISPARTRKHRKLASRFIDDDDSDCSIVTESKNARLSRKEMAPCDGQPSTKDFRVVVIKLPKDLKEIKSRFKLKIIYDQQYREIDSTEESVKNKSNGSGKMENRDKLNDSSEAPPEAAVEDSAPNNMENHINERSNSDSDQSVCNTKSSKNIPKKRKATLGSRKRRAVSDSDEEEVNQAKSPTPENAETNGNGNSDDETNDDKSSEEDTEFNPKNTASGRGERAAKRALRSTGKKGSKQQDKDGDADSVEEKDDFQPRKKRTRIRRNSPSSSDEESENGSKSKKRRRIKKKKSDENSDGDSPTKGRKNIRKLLKKSDLEETTKNAEQEERERKQRIAERQKLYNQVYDEKPEEARILDKLVLDFDEETKEPLLEVDKNLVKHLKPHQANGIKFMFDSCFESLDRTKESKGTGCILAHCMGLGKTLQIVTLTHTLLANADTTGIERVLVVCPLSTVLNWVNEYRIWMKHVKKGTEVEVYEISKYKDNVTRANKLMEWHNEGGVMILGYDMFRNLSNPTASRIRKKVRESLQTSLIDPGPDLIVCDEGHLLKNEKTSLSQMVNRITTMRRIVLTGTPIQNNMKEYYCMVQFVKPKLLGTYNEYMNRFVNPITNGQYTDSTPFDIQLMRKRAHVLHKLLDGCVQRRDYSVLAPFLPPKLEFVLSIKLSPMQCTLYKHYMENLAGKRNPDDLMQKRSSALFVDFQNLQRIWTHPRVLRFNSDRYEIVQQKKRDMASDSESVGSMKDFLDDSESEESAQTTPESSDSEDVKLVDSDDREEGDDGSSKSDKVQQSSTTTRRTRKNLNLPEEEVEKPENPTEWWMQMCPETELDNLEHSGKLQLLMEILKECETIGDKLLVFSQSLYSLDVIEHFLSLLDENTQKNDKDKDEILSKYPGSWAAGLDYFRLDGSTSIDNRNEACKVFNDESNTRARLFLISTRAGGLGINLVAANRVVIFDVSWNPSHDIQSIFRVYRFGQSKPCYIYRFIALGTMEEKIYERQVTKQAISKRVIDEQQIDRHYKENDLQELYRYEVETSEPRPTPILPKDRLFAELLKRFDNLIYKYHEHDSLLENKEEETLNEEERKAAWEEFEQEKNKPPMPAYGSMGMAMGMGMIAGNMGMGGMAGRVNGPITSSTIYGFRNDVLLKLLNIKAREDNPSFNDATINALIPYMMQELTRQMKDGELTLHSSLRDLYHKLEVGPVANQYFPMGFAPPGGMPAQQGMVHQPMMMGSATQGNMMPNMFVDPSGIARVPFAPNVQMQTPGISGIPRTGQILPTNSAAPKFTIDPEVVELD